MMTDYWMAFDGIAAKDLAVYNDVWSILPNTGNNPLLPLVLVRLVTRLADVFLTYCNLNGIY